jgi:tRNA-splicing ligase RtcB
MSSFVRYETDGVPIKAWTRGVPIADNALQQLRNTALLPIVHGHVAVMPDVHWGLGATIGSVIPTVGAVVPAAVGVDIGCGMCAVRTSLEASDLPDDLKPLRTAVERAVPHGRSSGRRRDVGSWGDVPKRVGNLWTAHLEAGFRTLVDRHRVLEKTNNVVHLGTLGTGNHFIEMAKKDMGAALGELPDKDLAYLREGTEKFDDYVEAVTWAQDFARINRQVMMENVIEAAARTPKMRSFTADELVVNCHHNYVQREHHFGRDCLVTRKGAVRAGRGDLGIIPGSMGAKSFIVRGKGAPESFESCSHGAGRVMSRTEAKRTWSLDQHVEATRHVECRKDPGVLDETPMAYKDIDAIMRAQADLVDVVHTLRQVVCVKG